MKTSLSICSVALAVTLAFMMTAGSLYADVYTLKMPHYKVNPGETLKVPLSLDKAKDLAQIRVQLNYDPQVLSFVSVTAGDLGKLFDFSHEDVEGVVTMDFVRATSLLDGTGVLAIIEFRANSGATVDLYSDLTIAQFEMGDDSGVRDLAVQHSQKVVSGSVRVSLNDHIDNAANGLADWWEEKYDMNVFRKNADDLDDDGDGMKNIFEYHFGANPHLNDRAAFRPQCVIDSESQFLSLTYQRRQGPEGERLSVWESEDLKEWNKLDPTTRMLTPPQDLGNGFEKVTIHGLLPIGDANGPSRAFLRLVSDAPASE
jgi:hypothetical protein